MKDTPTPRLERFTVAIVVLALLGGAVVVMSFINLPAENKDVVFQLVGGINALAGLVVGSYFRSPNDGGTAAPDNPKPSTTLPQPTFGKE